METRKVTKKSKVWIVGWMWFSIGIPLLLAGCSQVTDKGLIGGPYPPSKVLPEVVYEHDYESYEHDSARLTGLTYMGWIEVRGSKGATLKAAAKLGARVVKLISTSIEYEVTDYEVYRDGDVVTQRVRDISTKIGHGYRVYLYR